ncbi:unnamed protein product [Penicillium glandicola]
MALSSAKAMFFYPHETAHHAATILGFPSKVSIPSAYYESACVDIANLASVISAHEPVRLYARSEDVHKAKSMISQAITKYPSNTSNISVIPFPTNHLWVRDTGPVYVRGVGESIHQRFAVNFRFNEWGRKYDVGQHDRAPGGLEGPVMTAEQIEENGSFARRVIEADALPSPVTPVESQICLEGGALVVDGQGTLLATESSIINENRKPGLSKTEIQDELCRLLGVEKIIWFPGRKDLDVTDVHTDAEVSFIRPGVVVLSRPHSSAPKAWLKVFEEIKEILGKSVDAKGRRFEVHVVDEPNPKTFGVLSYDDPATNYVNFYFVNGGLILPQFGDPRRDQEALVLFQKLCPDRVVRPMFMAALPLDGGVIRSATQPVLSVEDASPTCISSRVKIARPVKHIRHGSSTKDFPQGDLRISNAVSQQHKSKESESRASASSSSSSSQRSFLSSPLGANEAWTPESTDVMIISPEKLLAAPSNFQTTTDALRAVMDVEQFSVIHLPFMLGDSFIPESQKTIYVILKLSAPVLTEGYLAFLGMMTNYQKSLVIRRVQPDMFKAAMGLQHLRSVKITHDHDAACALFLGQTMYVFNVLTATYSNTAHAIVRSALMSAKSLLPRLVQIPIMDTITMSPILIDTVECLVHREIPIMRLYPQRRVIVDRYVGLCATLLPHLYDICECSNALKRDAPAIASESYLAIHDRLDELEETIRRWRPKTPARLFERYGQHAVLAIVTQANVYRLAALLIIHRLQYALGVEDEIAWKLANGIFSELAFFAKSAVNVKESSALPVVFPLTMAMFEINGPGEDLLDRFASFSVQSASALRLQEFVKLARASRESGFEGIWFDLVDTHLRVAVPP